MIIAWLVAQVGAQGPIVTDADQIGALIEDLVDQSFPELAEARIGVRIRAGRRVLFVSQPHLGSWIAPGQPTTYVIGVSRHALTADLPLVAARGILAHELAHTLSYARGGSAAIWAAGWTQVWPPARIRNERRTDLVALARGYGEDLAAYRRWIYGRLDPAALAAKRRTYLTPEGIAAVERAPATLRARWLRHPPPTLAAIEADLAAQGPITP